MHLSLHCSPYDHDLSVDGDVQAIEQLPGHVREGLGISASLSSLNQDQDELITWRSGWPRDVELDVPRTPLPRLVPEDIPSAPKAAHSAESSTWTTNPQQSPWSGWNCLAAGTFQKLSLTEDSCSNNNKASQ